ncbi:MAG: flavodoxin family protein [Desulfovibrionaceae bacterium]|nr:flavodoxin family protein [Desulfovibrionaceae bacterium]
MKVLLVNGSSHLHGTTARVIEEMLPIFAAEGVETEVIQLGAKAIADCLQCNKCKKTGQCVLKDDGVNDFVAKAKSSDGFIFASPTYFAHASGRILAFLDRVFYSNGKDEVYPAFQFKPAAAICVARRAGATTAIDDITKYFGIAQMPIAGSTYWNNVHGLYADEVHKDEEGMQTVRNLARNLIWMMRCFELGKQNGIPYPATENTYCTNFIKRNDNER